MGFIGGKMPLQHGPAEGEEGLQKNIAELADMREKVGDDFWLMLDCWMSLDLDYATRLAQRRTQYGLKWIEEALIARRLLGLCRAASANVPQGMLVTTGEHEATRWGFRMLLEMGCCDIIQPDVGLVRRHDRADQDLRTGRRARGAGRAARIGRLQLPFRRARGTTARSPSS